MSSLSITSTVTLNNGLKMPLLGLGVSGLEIGEQTEQAIHWALETGYRHIDTAKLYKNESSVGSAIRNSPIKRGEIWVTTKLWPTDFPHPRKALEGSLQRLGLDYVDLYLIHWPTPVVIPGFDQKLWKSMERLVDAGLCKSIGVSNYLEPRLAKILSSAKVPPAVNQVRCSPFNYPEKLHTFCKQHGIALEAYSPLTRGNQLSDPGLKQLAQKYNKTAAQIMLRWAIQKDIIVIPKSQSKARIQENARIFDFQISENDVSRLNAFTR